MYVPGGGDIWKSFQLIPSADAHTLLPRPNVSCGEARLK